MSATASGSSTGDSGAATTDSAGETIYSGFAGESPSSTGGNGGDSGSNGGGDQSGASTLVRVWALSAGQTFGTLGLVGGIIGGFAILL